MNPYRCLLNTLSAQTKSGDEAAGVRLHQEMEPRMVVMVRQSLQSDCASIPMKPEIIAEARRVGLTGALAPGKRRDQLIQKVARRVCRAYIRGLPAEARDHMVETVRNSGHSSVVAG